MCGLSWWTTDIGGFHGGDPSDPRFRELFVRWFQWATFCPVMRLHGDREPRQTKIGTTGGASCRSGADNEVWSYGPEVFEICKKYMELREELRPYTRKLMTESHEKGSPVIRTLFYEFPDDPICWEVEVQYMYGEKYLCCPVLEEGQTEVKVYFPKLTSGEKWKRLWSEDAWDGGSYVVVESPLQEMPVFIRTRNHRSC